MISPIAARPLLLLCILLHPVSSCSSISFCHPSHPTPSSTPSSPFALYFLLPLSFISFCTPSPPTYSSPFEPRPLLHLHLLSRPVPYSLISFCTPFSPTPGPPSLFAPRPLLLIHLLLHPVSSNSFISFHTPSPPTPPHFAPHLLLFHFLSHPVSSDPTPTSHFAPRLLLFHLLSHPVSSYSSFSFCTTSPNPSSPIAPLSYSFISFCSRPLPLLYLLLHLNAPRLLLFDFL